MTTTNLSTDVADTTQRYHSHLVRRAMIVTGLAGIALVHLLDVPDKIRETPYVGWLFIGLIVSSLIVAELLIRADDVRIWLAAGALAAATAIGYAVSRTIGLPGDQGSDLGNWFEPLGLASLLLEGMVLWLAAARLAAARR